MADLPAGHALLIVMFCMVAPTLDQFSDLTLVVRLFSGPDQNTSLNAGVL